MRKDQADEGVEIVVCRTTQYTGPGVRVARPSTGDRER